MKKLLTWPAPLLQKWLLSLLLCLPFLAAAIVSAFSGDRTFLILSALLLLFCGVRCAELYVMLANERYYAFVFRFSAFRFSASAGSFCKKQTENRSSSASKRTSGCLWGKPIRSIYRSVQLSMKLRTHICRAPVHWQSRKLNPCLSIAWNRQTEPLSFLKLLSTCFH